MRKQLRVASPLLPCKRFKETLLKKQLKEPVRSPTAVKNRADCVPQMVYD